MNEFKENQKEHYKEVFKRLVDSNLPVNQDNIHKITLQITRETIYEKFPVSDPKVVEALLLLLQEYSGLIREERGYIKLEDLPESVWKEIERIALALNRTVKKLAGK